MKNYKYSIELVLKDECNIEIAAAEFSRALELPKKMFQENLEFMSLRYQEDEMNIAIEHCKSLNEEIKKYGYNEVEFKIKDKSHL
ncbi:MAG TPA: hypothetical protein VHO90_19190 [Bacteroidales bacterium]|jgi:hypothetical protein|nr:hypothetical protein [Bacteroidales bacterium]